MPKQEGFSEEQITAVNQALRDRTFGRDVQLIRGRGDGGNRIKITGFAAVRGFFAGKSRYNSVGEFKSGLDGDETGDGLSSEQRAGLLHHNRYDTLP